MKMLSVLHCMVENEGPMVIRVGEWFLGIRVRREGKPKPQVQTTNLGHPPCGFDSQARKNYLVRLRLT